MPTGRPKCPICQGKGTLTENAREYEFITRDPITAKCMICNGEGWLNPSTRLPNGKRVFEVFRKDNGTQKTGSTGSAGSGKRLNVSKKAVVNPETVDTGVGYEPQRAQRQEEESVQGRGWCGEICGSNLCAIRRTCETNPNPRLNKVMESGKAFLIVTETEPYYLDVYRMIRKREKKQGTWTEGDEEAFVEALMDERNKLITEIKKYKLQDEASTKEASNG